MPECVGSCPVCWLAFPSGFDRVTPAPRALSVRRACSTRRGISKPIPTSRRARSIPWSTTCEMARAKTCRVEPSSVVIHHEGGTPGRSRFSYSNRQTFVERSKDRLAADDTAIYRQDGYTASYDMPDVPEWELAGLAAFPACVTARYFAPSRSGARIPQPVLRHECRARPQRRLRLGREVSSASRHSSVSLNACASTSIR
jgi:hypothetical protein